MTVHISSQNPPCWNPSWLSDVCTTRKDPGSEWLARDKLGTNSITIKPETVSHVAKQSSWFPSPSCSPPRGPSPIKSLTVSACVSAGIIHFWVLDKRLFLSPGRGPPSCNICTIKMLPNSSLAANWKSSVGWKGKVALFRRPAISGEGGLMSKNQLWRFCSTMNVSKRRKGKLITVNHLGRGLEFSLSFTLCRLSSGEGHGNHSSILIWKIPWTEEPGRLQSMESLRVGHNSERLHFPFSLSGIGEGNGNPLQYSCLENPRDRGA